MDKAPSGLRDPRRLETRELSMGLWTVREGENLSMNPARGETPEPKSVHDRRSQPRAGSCGPSPRAACQTARTMTSRRIG